MESDLAALSGLRGAALSRLQELAAPESTRRWSVSEPIYISSLLLARASYWSETVKPITAFESHFRAAEVLLKVHRLLRNDASSEQSAEALPRLREAVGSDSDDGVLLL